MITGKFFTIHFQTSSATIELDNNEYIKHIAFIYTGNFERIASPASSYPATSPASSYPAIGIQIQSSEGTKTFELGRTGVLDLNGCNFSRSNNSNNVTITLTNNNFSNYEEVYCTYYIQSE